MSSEELDPFNLLENMGDWHRSILWFLDYNPHMDTVTIVLELEKLVQKGVLNRGFFVDGVEYENCLDIPYRNKLTGRRIMRTDIHPTYWKVDP